MGGTAPIDAVSPLVWESLAKVAMRTAGGEGAIVVFAEGPRIVGRFGATDFSDAFVARAALAAKGAKAPVLLATGAGEPASVIAAPLRAGQDEPLGALITASSCANAFDAEAAIAVGELGELVALGLADHFRLADELEEVDEERKSEHALVERGNEALRDANERLSAIIDTAPLAIYSVDTEGRVLTWNVAAERLFGWSAAECIGAPLPIVGADKQGEFAELRRRMLGGERLADIALTRSHRSGRRLELSVSTALLRDASGRPVAISAIAADVTERRRVEEQLHQSQKLEALGRLAGGVAHDFNNLLAVVQSYAGLLEKGFADGDPRAEHVKQIRAAGDRAATLTRQLLAFGRKQVLQPVLLDVNTIVESMVLLLRRVLGDDVDLEIDLAPGLEQVKADPSQLERVILNLCLNARDAMPEGGKIRVRTRPNATGPLASGGVELSVSDTGHGMDASTQEQIFDPFFTTKEPGRGTGLGLSTVYGVVQQSGGAIRVESAPGRGSTFRVYLPRADGVTMRAPSAEADGEPARSADVLLVEDDPLVRLLAARILREESFRVVEAATADAALRLADEPGRHIDALITDVSMPGMNGRVLAAEIARLRPTVKVLFVSGYGVAGGALEPGTAFLAKPFTPATLVGTLRLLLAG